MEAHYLPSPKDSFAASHWNVVEYMGTYSGTAGERVQAFIKKSGGR